MPSADLANLPRSKLQEFLNVLNDLHIELGWGTTHVCLYKAFNSSDINCIMAGPPTNPAQIAK